MEAHAHPARQETLPVLTVTLGIGSQVTITTINPAHSHHHTHTQKILRMDQDGRIGGPDFGLGLLLVA